MHENSQIEDEEAVIAEIMKLMNKMEQIYERQYRAERQIRAVAKRSASESKRESNEIVNLILIIRTRPSARREHYYDNLMMGWALQ